MDTRDWWNLEEGDPIIKKCLSRNWYQAIQIAMFDMDSSKDAIASAEQILQLIKNYIQACFNLPRFVTIDECMTLSKIHHLVSNLIFYFYLLFI